METRDILVYYGRCCVSEASLEKFVDYPVGEEGTMLKRTDDRRLENIRGQKQAIEEIMCG